MQLLIAMLISQALAASGEFNAKVAAHAHAVAVTSKAIQGVTSNQGKSQVLANNCIYHRPTTQESILACAAQFSKLSHDLEASQMPLIRAVKVAEALPAEFDSSKAVLLQNLSEATTLVNLSIVIPRKIADTFYKSNEQLLRSEMSKAGREAFASRQAQLYCKNFQSEMLKLAALADISLQMKSSFAVLYRHSLRVQSLLTLRPAVEQICNIKVEDQELKALSTRLQSQSSQAPFTVFKEENCKRNKNKTLSERECMSLPKSPYSVHWLEAAGGKL